LESLQCGVDGAKCHVTPSFLFDLPRYRHAIRALAEPDDREHDQQLKFAEVIRVGHFFDYNEEIAPRLTASVWMVPGRLGHFWKVSVGQFLASAEAEGKLKFFGQLADLAEPARFHAWLRKLEKTEWVVYAKPPFGGPEAVLKYLARYTHRVAISSSRLLSLDNGCVTFRWRDSRHGNQTKSMTLEAVEFIRRFLLHILPPGFIKIRHFGFLANRNRSSALDLCRQHLNASSPADDPAILASQQQADIERRCPVCHTGLLRIVDWLSTDRISACQPVGSPLDPVDSS
jgi:hypothetical protein